MVLLKDIPEPKRTQLLNLDCPVFETTPWCSPPALNEARVCIVSTAGIHLKDDVPFGLGDHGYRLIPGTVAEENLVMTHVSPNFDREGYNQDLNVIFPINRLQELAIEGVIGSVSDIHASFMGATDPRAMEKSAAELASVIRADGVDVVLLVPV